MEKRFERKALAHMVIAAGRHTTPWVDKKVEEARAYAQSNRVQISSPVEGRVVQLDGRIHVVNLDDKTCSCLVFQENGIPCGHAMTLILATGAQITPYLPEDLSAVIWAQMYEDTLPPVSINDLDTDAEALSLLCDPPVTRVPRGRPKKERVRRQDARNPRGRRDIRDHGGMLPLGAVVAAVPNMVHSRCSTCGEAGHNARRCRRPHQ
jgi:hypothetical protein